MGVAARTRCCPSAPYARTPLSVRRCPCSARVSLGRIAADQSVGQPHFRHSSVRAFSSCSAASL